jgi:mannose-1-phosphate guanylyltransferase
MNIIILCGGSGTRLWPLSREHLPKQLINLTSEKTMLQITVDRALKCDPRNIYLICNEKHQFIIDKQMKDIDLQNYKIIIEPFGKNTAAAIATACQIINDNSKMLILPSDHIWDDNIFSQLVDTNKNLTDNGIVVFGIQPKYAETGYGYLCYKDNNLKKFVEKPNKKVAEQYINSGDYLWNSGVFYFKCDIMKNEFQKYASDIWESVNKTLTRSKWSDNILKLDKEYFSQVKDESIDYAIMEHHDNGKIIKYDSYWSDIGSFKSLHDYLKKDINNNYLDGDIKIKNTQNCLIKSDKLVTTLDIDNLVIIDTPDALFIANKDSSQDVKIFVNSLNDENRVETKFHTKVFRPWGWYTNIEGSDHSGSKVKRIGVYPNKRLSLQSHKRRSEHWVITKGNAKVQIGEDVHVLHKNQNIYIPIGVLHRLENIGDENVELIETQIGDYLGEDDIIRYEDDFGRK